MKIHLRIGKKYQDLTKVTQMWQREEARLKTASMCTLFMPSNDKNVGKNDKSERSSIFRNS